MEFITTLEVEQDALLWKKKIKRHKNSFAYRSNPNTLFKSTAEPPRDKTNKMTERPAKTQISLGESSMSA